MIFAMTTHLGDGQTLPDPDYLWGAEAIARCLGLTERQVFHHAERRTLPIGKVGNRLFARRSKLSAFLDEQIDHSVSGESNDPERGRRQSPL